MGNGCSSSQNNVVDPSRGNRSSSMRSNGNGSGGNGYYHEVNDDNGDFTVTSWAGGDRGSRGTSLMKSNTLPESPKTRSRSNSSGGNRSGGRRMSMSQKDPPALRSQQSHAFMHTNSVAHKSGDEVRRQAEEFEQYGSELEVCLPSQEEKEFRRDLRFYTTLFGDLEPRDLLFEWNDRFELGITFVDKQHFKLVELINELHHAERTDSQRWIVGYVLEKLVQYTGYHFNAEEKVMEEFGYDQDVMLGHKQKHKDFVSKVVDFRNKFQSMQELDLGQVILEFLKNWLANHILHSDVKMCNFVKEKLIERGAESAPADGQNP